MTHIKATSVFAFNDHFIWSSSIKAFHCLWTNKRYAFQSKKTQTGKQKIQTIQDSNFGLFLLCRFSNKCKCMKRRTFAVVMAFDFQYQRCFSINFGCTFLISLMFFSIEFYFRAFFSHRWIISILNSEKEICYFIWLWIVY